MIPKEPGAYSQYVESKFNEWRGFWGFAQWLDDGKLLQLSKGPFPDQSSAQKWADEYVASKTST